MWNGIDVGEFSAKDGWGGKGEMPIPPPEPDARIAVDNPPGGGGGQCSYVQLDGFYGADLLERKLSYRPF